jgi:parallel beta-helix repeat protein
MKHFLTGMLLLACGFNWCAAKTVKLKKGMVITQSVTIAKGDYTVDADTSLQQALITIRGNNITVDFNQAVLQGSANTEQPNQFYGLAVRVEKGSTNITILNASIHGYKVALLADSVTHLQVYNSNLSYNYRQQLHSNWRREDVSDWMSYHHNENGEWLRYGAGIYLTNCSHAVIKGNTITGGQCGLMMTRCNRADVYQNNFTFNSGIGIGMYRSSHNNIYQNNLDFNVRGYSDSLYNRGQDSGGILVFEQSSNNVFAYNSVTHSGDGFFLWAGQHTMDTGEGGCNHNTIYENDFSFAPTNGIEVTFSKNDIEKNIINDCDNGIWGGYSYGSFIYDNTIQGNKTGIAIEHGQDNTILFNKFEKNKTAIKLWSRATQPADWGYAKYRDTRSKNYRIYANEFTGENIVYDIMGTDSIWLAGNPKHNTNKIFKTGDRLTRLDTSKENGYVDFTTDGISASEKIVSTLPRTTYTLMQYPFGRGQMRITEWGPYNFAYPLLWLKKVDSNGVYHFEVLHPIGSWTIKNSQGFTILGQNKNSLIARVDSSVQHRSIGLTFTGLSFNDGFGRQHHAGIPYTFGYYEFDAHAKWTIRYYRWDTLHNPNNNYYSFLSSLQAPFFIEQTPKIDYTWWGTVGKDLPADTFATVAESIMVLPASHYTISITAYDMVKLFIDGTPVIDAWDASNALLDERTNHTIHIPISAGKHAFKIIQAANSGLAALMFYIKPEKFNN